MTYRDLLDKLQLMAEIEPSLLNYEVIMELENEYFTSNEIGITEIDNDFVQAKQPIIVLES